MTYRGLPYFVTQSSGIRDRVNPYTTERHTLPDRVHGIRYSAAPKTARRRMRYIKCTTVCPSRIHGVTQKSKPLFADIEPLRLLTTVLLMAAIALLAAFASMGITYGFTGSTKSAFGDDGSSFSNSLAKTTVASTPSSNWEKGAIPHLYLSDPQWATHPYGSKTLGTAGSAPLCLTMAHIALTGDTTQSPQGVTAFAQNNGYTSQSMATELLTTGATELGLTVHTVEANELSIRRELNTGHPVICAIRAGVFGSNPTYIILDSINEHGQLIIVDPSSVERSQTPWNFENILATSTALWSYDVA